MVRAPPTPLAVITYGVLATVSLLLISGSYPPMWSADKGIHVTLELDPHASRVRTLPAAAVEARPNLACGGQDNGDSYPVLEGVRGDGAVSVGLIGNGRAATAARRGGGFRALYATRT